MRNEDGGKRPPTARTVAVLALETGGCGACSQSVAALQSIRYAAQLEANRIAFVQSPRQADVVLLSGPFAIGAGPAVRRVIDLVPEPQALVAIGDCAINGCVFSGSAEISSSASEALDVHIELPGCPPSPSSILSAIIRASELLAESNADDEEAAGAAEEEDNAEVDDETADAPEAPDTSDDTEPPSEE